MDEEDAPRKKSRVPLLAGLGLAVVLGGGGFYAVYSGMLDFGGEKPKEIAVEGLPNVTFVPIDPVQVSLGRGSSLQNLRFEGHLEVGEGYAAEVTAMMPRVMDVLNTYLRAVETSDLRDPQAMLRLRAQMLRRVQVVTGEGRVRDLLIAKFLVS